MAIGDRPRRIATSATGKSKAAADCAVEKRKPQRTVGHIRRRESGTASRSHPKEYESAEREQLIGARCMFATGGKLMGWRYGKRPLQTKTNASGMGNYKARQ